MKHWVLLLLLVGTAPRGGAAAITPTPAQAQAQAQAQAHWSFQAIQDPAPPGVTNTAWGQTSIDRFILAKLETLGQRPSSPADRRTWIRRASLDLTGLPPSAAEIETFEADASPDAHAKLINHLLDSPHYGEHWGRHWLDVVRYADTAGETADYPVPVAWRYRNYVIDSFNNDKPYHLFLQEQIAGDILAQQGPREQYAAKVTATGYLAISRRFGFDSENYQHLTIQDTIDNVGQTVLGLTLGCARCHHHKFDPVSLSDYYALYGIFESTRYSFPGSEQKQKSRVLAPLLPREESRAKWRKYETRVATLTRKLAAQKKSFPAAILRSLDEMDGDFELQAPAAGGSNGVLVPPWLYDGPIAVTTDAQSPYKNLHPSGKVGASIDGAIKGYRIAQTLHPARTRQLGNRLFVNLDVRLATNEPSTAGVHRFWLGTQGGEPAVEILWSSTNVAVRTGDHLETIRTLQPGKWHNLQLTLELGAGKVFGQVGTPEELVSFPERSLASTWNGRLDYVAIDAPAMGAWPLPGLTLDNLGVQEFALAPLSSALGAAPQSPEGSDPAVLTSRLRQLVGGDGDFELQTDRTAPAAPWGPGPTSVVQIQPSAQSPFRNLYPTGQRGIQLPNSSNYNGFDQALPTRYDQQTNGLLCASFDFRCGSADAGAGGNGNGTWRFYLGHGAGGSAAVELYLNASEFFRRSGNQRTAVGPLRLGEWYQVQLTLDLKAKTYTGSLNSSSSYFDFTGDFATGWDGIIDFVLVDSHGQIGGVKPATDWDNFAFDSVPFPGLQARASASVTDAAKARKTEIAELRQQLAKISAEADQTQQELETLLVDGPFELTYAVSEGTPRDARIQLRGEPDKPGEIVPRGLLPVLNGGRLPSTTTGSGRLELAQWLTTATNPLTARVMVNRLWQYHFGQGLVKTPNDFGTRGRAPSHPELLDYLATQFIRSGWSIKALHRLIMNSAVYQQASETTPAHAMATAVRSSLPVTANTDDCPVLTTNRPHRKNPELMAGDSYSSFPRRRLGAEETRDAVLFVCGQLDPTPGQGHPFPTPLGWGYTQHNPFSAVYEHHRRSVYLMTQRIKRHPFLALFDGPDPNSTTAERRTTTVPTQALYFLNDPFIHNNSEHLAQRTLTADPSSQAKRTQIGALYRQVLARAPTITEQTEATEFLDRYRTELTASGHNNGLEKVALAALGRVLLGSNEFLTVD